MSDHKLRHLNYLGFQLFQPALLLRDFVQEYWMIRSDASMTYREEFLHPTGGAGIVFNFGNYFSIDHQAVTATCFLDSVNTLSRRLNFGGEVYAIGVRFLPGGAYPFFNLPIFEIVDKPYDLAELQVRQVKNTAEQLYLATTVAERVYILDRWLSNLLNENRLVASTVYGAMGMIRQSHGQRPMHEIGDKIGLSARHLQRQYKLQVGISPKQHAQLLRINFARLAIKHLDNRSFADVAYHAGYYDQSHFIREFKSVVGMTPGAYHTRHQERYEK